MGGYSQVAERLPLPASPLKGSCLHKYKGTTQVGNENQGCLQMLHTVAGRKETGERQKGALPIPAPDPCNDATHVLCSGLPRPPLVK